MSLSIPSVTVPESPLRRPRTDDPALSESQFPAEPYAGPRRLRAVLAHTVDEVRTRLATLLPAEGLDLEAICDSAPDAIAAVRAFEPDVIVLATTFPGMDAFSLLRQSTSQGAQRTILIAESDALAMRAFDAGVVDYLLTPFTVARLRRAVARCQALSPTQTNGALRRAFDPPRLRFHERLLVRVGNRYLFVRSRGITWVEGAGNYARLHLEHGTCLVRLPLHDFDQLLDPNVFVRIHRSTIVNVERIRELRPLIGGNFVVTMDDGTELRLTRTFRRDFERCAAPIQLDDDA